MVFPFLAKEDGEVSNPTYGKIVASMITFKPGSQYYIQLATITNGTVLQP